MSMRQRIGNDAYERAMLQAKAELGVKGSSAAPRRNLAETAQYYNCLRNHVERGGMLALTVHQPYAYLLCLPDGDEQAKRVENRSWMPPKWLIGKRIVIHSGKSKKRVTYGDEIKWPLKYGVGIGTVKLEGALRKHPTGSPATGWECEEFPRGYEWLAMHKHSEGPCCWVVGDSERFDRPIERPGAQGLWMW